jgi:aromatic-L-amino-acid decarboxylase
MPSLQLSPKEFRTLADRVAELASDFLADLPNRQTVSSTSAVDTSLAFDLPLLEEGIGEAVIDDLVAIAEHVRAPTGRRLPYVIGSGEPISALADFYASVLTRAILRSVNQRGRVWLSKASIRGAVGLRACITNHRTTDDDIGAVVEEVLAAAEETA